MPRDQESVIDIANSIRRILRYAEELHEKINLLRQPHKQAIQA